MDLEPLSLLPHTLGPLVSKHPILTGFSVISALVFIVGVVGLVGFIPVSADELAAPWNGLLAWSSLAWIGLLGQLLTAMASVWVYVSNKTQGSSD